MRLTDLANAKIQHVCPPAKFRPVIQTRLHPRVDRPSSTPLALTYGDDMIPTALPTDDPRGPTEFAAGPYRLVRRAGPTSSAPCDSSWPRRRCHGTSATSRQRIDRGSLHGLSPDMPPLAAITSRQESSAIPPGRVGGCWSIGCVTVASCGTHDSRHTGHVAVPEAGMRYRRCPLLFPWMFNNC